MAKLKENPVIRPNKARPNPRSGLLGRPEIRILISLFVIAGLILTFGHIAEEVIEGDSAKFDQTVVLLFRHANDLSNAIGPPWMEEMARDITALGSYAVLIIITGCCTSLSPVGTSAL